jgi:hypothetical protein
MPVLDLIDPELPATEARAQPLGVLNKCHHALGWLQQFVKEAKEYAGSHVLSMVHAHYPLIDFKHSELGYPKEVGPKQADELRIQLLNLSASIHQLVRDVVIAGAGAIIFKSATGSCVSTSQSPMPETLSTERPEAAVSTS